METAESILFIYVYQLSMTRPFRCSRIYKSREDAEKGVQYLQQDQVVQSEEASKHDAQIQKRLAVYDYELKRVSLISASHDITFEQAELDFLRGYNVLDSNTQ